MSTVGDFNFDDLFNEPNRRLSEQIDTENDEEDEEDLEHDDTTEKEDVLEEIAEDCKKRLPLNKKVFEDFTILKAIGVGTYGKVYQVKDKQTDKIYAMKLLRKSHLLKTQSVENTITEKDILQKIRHPFIVDLFYTFQTQERVGFIMEYVNGGQLFFHLRREGTFSLNTTRFYAAELILALEHLHENHIIHRDLKPENILLDSTGHLVLTDFGLAKQEINTELATTICGTIEYMSPEMLGGKKYGKSTDFWSVGILIFDMLNGTPPFQNENRKKLQELILKRKIRLNNYWKPELKSLIRGLTNRDPKKRLNINQIKKHSFFKKIDWNKLKQRGLNPPFKPKVVNGVFDISNFDEKYTRKRITQLSPAQVLSSSQNELFKGFSYVRSEDEEKNLDFGI